MERWNFFVAEHFLYPQFDALGKEPRLAGPAHIDIRGPRIRAGDYLHVFATARDPVSFAVDPFLSGAGELTIGDYCIFAPGTRIRSAVSIRIGDNCMFAESALITDADWHDPYHRIYPGKREPVVIEDNVWLCDRVTVCKGVTIGENSIIGASSVVTRDIPKNTIAAGNPARPVGGLDPGAHMTRRDALFAGGMPYQDFKNEFDRFRLNGNTLFDWMRARLFPGGDD